MPDRLPSLILLIGCWVPAAMAGRAAAEIVHRRANGVRPALVRGGLIAFVIASAVSWFFINLIEVPPYLPGATMDPTSAPPETVRALAIFTSALVLPVSAIACWVSFRMRVRSLMRIPPH